MAANSSVRKFAENLYHLSDKVHNRNTTLISFEFLYSIGDTETYLANYSRDDNNGTEVFKKYIKITISDEDD